MRTRTAINAVKPLLVTSMFWEIPKDYTAPHQIGSWSNRPTKYISRISVMVVAICSFLLHGCASASQQSFTSFPSAAELGTPERHQQRYEEARADFQRAVKGLEPLYAVRRSAFYDGGTAFYRGAGYEITVWKRLSTSAGGETDVYAGPEIHFSRSLSPQGPVTYSVARSRKLN